ncbi:MAG: hypothetical protein QOF25_5162 [Mycobacterium sp.]|jgi:hypothetical protein|nr:hypothetical protein [Mycobacterium sp.]
MAESNHKTSNHKTYPCERVDLDFIASATAITKVVWTSSEPRGVGTTRTVSMRGAIVGDEEFIAWEPFSHMAFRFNQSTSNAVSGFAEDYRVVQTADAAI